MARRTMIRSSRCIIECIIAGRWSRRVKTMVIRVPRSGNHSARQHPLSVGETEPGLGAAVGVGFFSRASAEWMERSNEQYPGDPMRSTEFLSLFCVAVLLIGGCAKRSPVQSLIDAASGGDVAQCEQLVKSGVPVDGTDNGGDTALDWAIYRHQVSVVQKLIELGADVNHADHGRGYEVGLTPLMYTATPLRGRKHQDPETMAVRNQIA